MSRSRFAESSTCEAEACPSGLLRQPGLPYPLRRALPLGAPIKLRPQLRAALAGLRQAQVAPGRVLPARPASGMGFARFAWGLGVLNSAIEVNRHCPKFMQAAFELLDPSPLYLEGRGWPEFLARLEGWGTLRVPNCAPLSGHICNKCRAAAFDGKEGGTLQPFTFARFAGNRWTCQ